MLADEDADAVAQDAAPDAAAQQADDSSSTVALSILRLYRPARVPAAAWVALTQAQRAALLRCVFDINVISVTLYTPQGLASTTLQRLCCRRSRKSLRT